MDDLLGLGQVLQGLGALDHDLRRVRLEDQLDKDADGVEPLLDYFVHLLGVGLSCFFRRHFVFVAAFIGFGQHRLFYYF